MNIPVVELIESQGSPTNPVGSVERFTFTNQPQINDLVVFMARHANVGNIDNTVVPFSMQRGPSYQLTNAAQSYFWKVCDGTEGKAWDFDQDNTSEASYCGYIFRNTHPVMPVGTYSVDGASSGFSNSDSITIPSVKNGYLLAGLAGTVWDSNTAAQITPAAGWATDKEYSGGVDHYRAGHYNYGPTGAEEDVTFSVTATTQSGAWSMFGFQILPANVGDPKGTRIFRKPWTRQPPPGTEIDWSNPFAKDLVFFSLYGQDATKTLKTGEILPNTIRIPTKLGQGEVYLGSVSNGIEWTEQRPFKADGPQTLLHYGNVPPGAASDNALLSQRYTGGEGPYPMTSLDINTDLNYGPDSGKVLSYTQNAAGNEVTAVTSNVVLDGDYHWIAATKDSTISNSTKIYIDGISQAVTHQTGGDSMTATGWADNNASFATGHYAEGTYRSVAGQIAVINAAWTRELSEEEINRFQENPWQIFEPQTFIVPAGDAVKRRVVTF